MDMILALGIFWTVYGIAGLFGFQNLPERFKNQPWTKEYTRYLGLTWLAAGIPWIILHFVFKQLVLGRAKEVLLLLVFSAPSIIYNVYIDRKYKKRLEEQTKEEK